ncbi:archaeosortase/exosortase family protein [Rhodococcus sp. HNM0569]|uniref:archaeosortase/exosortase family protein n=1 Tax=Rhodococcus sp. HNM0569 TaxID=2716340 RepID=UPI00146F06A6|nr:archaeosortase/exosortase family protein [Rhodococcus sp. HNM0569]NLU83333.1 hypothetical protein [Rhodococcus sp. HNM0569]
MALNTQSRRIVDSLARRWVLIVALTGAAFWKTWANLWRDAAEGVATGYVFVLPLLCAVACVGVSLRRREELPIHDRQTDTIVGTILLLLSLGVQALLVPRLERFYTALHIDVLGVVVFVLGCCVLLFGTRPTARFWPVWLMAAVLNPLGYRFFGVLIGGGPLGNGLLMVIVAAFATSIAVSRDRTRAVVAFVSTLVVGLVVLSLVIRYAQYPSIIVLQLVPSTSAAVVVGGSFYFWHRRGASKAPLDRPLVPPANSASRQNISIVLTIVVAAGITMAIPLPPRPSAELAAGPRLPDSPGLAVPEGWTEQTLTTYRWPARYIDRSATLTRQSLVADDVVPGWDTQGRRRVVQLDVLTIPEPATLLTFPVEGTYEVQRARVSAPVHMDIGRGITATLFTAVDDKLLVTWSNLSFAWTNDAHHSQRVSLVSVDDHDPGAPFPEPRPSMPSIGRNLLSIVLRGGSSVSDRQPTYKDRTMLESVAREIVEAQQW